MKKLPVLLCIFLLSACAPSEVPSDKLLERNGIKYEINSQTPFAGVATVYYESGQLEFKDTYKGGKRNGIYEEYYENGQLRWKETYKGGKRNGLYESYYENGQLDHKTTYKDGKLNGLWEGYTENGQEYGFSPVCYKNHEKVDISKCKSL